MTRPTPSSLARLLALVVMTTGVAGACTITRATPEPMRAEWSAADAEEIRRRATESTTAWNRGDLKGHLAIYVDSVTFMTRNGPRPGIAPIEEQFTRTYFRDGMPKQQLRFEQMTVRPIGRDAALQNARFVLSGGGEPEQSGWFTLIWIRTPAGWRAMHDHSS